MLPGAPVLLSWPCSALVSLSQSLTASRQATLLVQQSSTGVNLM